MAGEWRPAEGVVRGHVCRTEAPADSLEEAARRHAARPHSSPVSAPSSNVCALRLDDVGASSKRYEVYSTRSWGLGRLRISGNWLFLKYLPGVKRWAPYRELTAAEWGA